MPRVNGIMQPLPNVYGVPGRPIESGKYNTQLDDLIADANNARPLTAGGTGGSSASEALTKLGLDPLFSTSAGNTAPVGTVKGRLWLDTSALPHLLKQYSGTAWVVLGTLDPATGLFQPAARTMAANSFSGRLATAGLEQELTIAQMQEALVLGNIVGAVLPFALTATPTGWLRCDGSLIPRTIYSRLFAAIGTSWGAGDGVTTFSVPDTRGYFLRALDEGRGLDTTRAFASTQQDLIGSHSHALSRGSPTGGGSDVLSTQGSNTAAGSTGLTGGVETRPKNIAMPFFIKF